MPRGPISGVILEALSRPPHTVPSVPHPEDDPLWGDDSALALYALHELHYRSFANVDDEWEWEPSLINAATTLERGLENRLREEVGWQTVEPGQVVDELFRLAPPIPGQSLSEMCRDSGTLGQLQEFAIHRSAYQLKEADPHTWAIPRLHGRAKAALVHIQAGEYGNGIPTRLHSELFATTMRALGLDDSYGAYLDRIPGTTLATVNLVSLFGLHRRWRGALVGHLAYFEMSSVAPMGRYAEALRRLGIDESGLDFYDEHVEADANHESIAIDGLVGGFIEEEPELASDVIFGAKALDCVEAAFARHLLDAWKRGASSLRAVP